MNKSASDPVATTKSGVVRGSQAPGEGAVFAGIPFAAPPIGTLRFRPPQPPSPWPSTRDATQFAPAPPQNRVMPPPGSGQAGTPGTAAGTERGAALLAAARQMAEVSSEDCLYLNVWTPSVQGRAPVLVWVYGGGFETGSASPPKFDGAAVSRLLGAVVVAANYRLGALGWLMPSGTDAAHWAHSANLGLQDQAAALRWVRDNIAAFGGNPDNITVAGASAGAFSVGALLALAGASGTFHKAALQSGSTARVTPAKTATAVTRDLMSTLGVDSMAALQHVPLDQLLDAQRQVVDNDLGTRWLPGGRGWGVVLDGQVLTRHPHYAVADGCAAGIPLLVGANRDEFRMFAALSGDTYRPSHEAQLRDEMTNAGVRRPSELVEAYRARLHDGSAVLPEPWDELHELRTLFLTDAIYRAPATRLADAQARAGGRAYSYLFTGEPFGPKGGAHHSADGFYLLDKLGALGIDTPEQRAVRHAYVGAWAKFVADGDPGWPTHDPKAAKPTRAIGTDAAPVDELPADVAEFWHEATWE
ncbi:carboxylesterase family protein [Yinghuangia sp. ASG 101]|uniref:carboxylesterase/lipase family protein n=1 Tax=Yinghuangia sp. ASG 101 TaxID=2896848 RepID=UPI001E30C1B5|nr:carboxylesterase family protein [Yinghuangia sp. ASG 101]UGQ13971.1 carboxylesterase family protein [Yinghuangia sp. ASG 101]